LASSALVLCAASLGCDRFRRSTPAATLDAGAAPDAGAAANASTSPQAPVPPASSASSTACATEPRGGVTIPDSARATDVRIAGTGGHVVVTWFETSKGREGPDVLTSVAHVVDADTGSVGPRTDVDKVDTGDEYPSGVVPVVVDGDVLLVSCFYGAPTGTYACARGAPHQKTPPTLFRFSGISNGGPSTESIAAVARGKEAVVFVPEGTGRDVHVFSSRVSGKKSSSPFRLSEGERVSVADGLVAVDTSVGESDEATVVFRHHSAIFARRAGFDESWHGKAVDLSGKSLVGAPVAATDGTDRVAVLFSQRKKATDSWRVRYVAVSPSGSRPHVELPTGEAQAQGPAMARSTPAGCFLVSWVEGTGKATRTRVARMCDQHGAPELNAATATTLSREGVEGGRAYLASDPARPANGYVVWQEIPAGKPAELRFAKLACP
jgi:hypothetical protein